MNEKVVEAVTALKRHIHYQPKIGIILGSGLGGLAEEIQDPVRVRFEDIPSFPRWHYSVVSNTTTNCAQGLGLP